MKTNSDSDSSASTRPKKACAFQRPTPVTFHSASSTIGTSTTVSRTMTRAMPSSPTDHQAPKAGIQGARSASGAPPT